MIKYLMLLCSFFFFSLSLMAQGDSFIIGKSIWQLRNESVQLLKIHPQSFTASYALNKFTNTIKESYKKVPKFLNSYDVDDLAFFCKLEVKIEKKLKIPFKFRLGEVQYTEKMEGKY